MKTSKITQVTANGTFDNAYGTFFKWEVHFENGDYGDANTKQKDQTIWVVGKEINYDLTPASNPKFNPKISISKEQPKPKENVDFLKQTNSLIQEQSKQPNVQMLIVAQSSIASACQFLQGRQADKDHIFEIAEDIYNWVIKKG